MAWSFLLPAMLVFGFAYLFTGKDQVTFKVIVNGDTAALQKMAPAFYHVRYLRFIDHVDAKAGMAKLKHHKVDMVIDIAQRKYWINSSSKNGYILERILWSDKKTAPAGLTKSTVTGAQVRYVDWVTPGILATNMMFNCLFGVGYVVVRYRKNGVLKRLKATPVTAFEFLSAQIVSRLLLIVAITVLVYVGCDWVIGIQMEGSYALLLLIYAMGAVSLIALGLVMAARTTSEEFAGGILNLVSWPMMLLSGVWFSLEGSEPWVLAAAQLLPVTHIVDAARAVMNDGAGLTDIAYHLLALLAMSLVCVMLGARLFRWD